jgi:transposase-like protein
MNHFPDEQSCKNHWKEQRENRGIFCKKCGCSEHYWLQGKWQWQCKECRFRTTLRSGTMMEHAKLPIRKWYLVMALMSATKKGFSAIEIQRQIGHSRYESIWSMIHRIRIAMGRRDDLYQLEGMIEFDEGYFEKSTPEGTRLKRGKGSQRQQNVAVMAESTPLENIEGKIISKQCRYFKMKVVEGHQKGSINEVIAENLDERSIVFTDQSKSYIDIAKYVDVHITEKSSKKVTSTTLRWVHIAISNAKRWLLGVHHKIKGQYLQSYLNEFCYKLNRRYFGERLFDRLIIAMI